MRSNCDQCSYQTEGDYPLIVSACLISFETHRSFNVMPDCVKAEEKQRRNCPLQTPKDASCSHILVFPTSATAQANTQQNQLGDEIGFDLSDTSITLGDFENNQDDFSGLMDVFVSMTENSPPISPRQDNPGSPGQLEMGRNSPSKFNGTSVVCIQVSYIV